MEKFDPDYINEIARTIAWAHWKAVYPSDVCRDELHLWEHLGEFQRKAYRKAAFAVAGM